MSDDLLSKAISDRDAHPWRYYRFEWEDSKAWLDKLAARVAALEAEQNALRERTEWLKEQGDMLRAAEQALATRTQERDEARAYARAVKEASEGHERDCVATEDTLAAVAQALEGKEADCRAKELALCRRADAQPSTLYAERLAGVAEVFGRCADDFAAIRALIPFGAVPAQEERTPYETGLCCLRDHANAVAPWTCSCPCHTLSTEEPAP